METPKLISLNTEELAKYHEKLLKRREYQKQYMKKKRENDPDYVKKCNETRNESKIILKDIQKRTGMTL